MCDRAVNCLVHVGIYPYKPVTLRLPLLQDEKLLVHICEEDIPDPFTFMVYLEELINNCSITHLFTEEEKSHVINAIRSSVTHAGIDFCQDSAWGFFLRFVHMHKKECIYVSY